MSKAHELLLEIGALQKELLDIDLALMLAECACALPDTDDEFEKALERVRHLVSGERALTYQLIDDWDAKLKKNGRFMGYIILQYALHASRFRYVSSESEIAKRLILAFIKNVLKRLHEVSDDVKEKPHEHLIAAIQTFIKTLVQCCERLTPDRSMHAYVEALCYNCNAWSLLCEGKYKTALDSVNRGLHIMEAGGYRGDPNERALYGDLHFNKGAALDRLERHEEAQNEFDKAAVIYETLVKDHPDEISKGKVAAVATECSINARLGGSRL